MDNVTKISLHFLQGCFDKRGLGEKNKSKKLFSSKSEYEYDRVYFQPSCVFVVSSKSEMTLFQKKIHLDIFNEPKQVHCKGQDITIFYVNDQIGIGLMVCQQFGGINGICFYTSSIFELAGKHALTRIADIFRVKVYFKKNKFQ